MEKSIGQRRRSFVDDCFQMKMDADHFNEVNPSLEPIQPVLDFSEDVAERGISRQRPERSLIALFPSGLCGGTRNFAPLFGC